MHIARLAPVTSEAPETEASVPEASVPARRTYSYLGPAGTFTEAALAQVPEARGQEWRPVRNVGEALADVIEGRSDAAMIAIENSVDGGVSTTQTVGKLRMKGREVFRHAVVNLADVLNEVLADAGLNASEVDWVVPHQANARILDATARKLGLPAEKVIVTVDQHANTSAASVPLAFDAAVRDGRIQRGDLVVLEAMGGGFTWGAAALRY